MYTAKINREFILAKCEYFSDIQIWPLPEKLNPEGWLSNFNQDDENEMKHAFHLLNSFIYYSETLINQMFQVLFQNLSMRLFASNLSFVQTRDDWKKFCDRVIFTRVTGEDVNDSDSGYLFVRRARQFLDIDEERILSPKDTLEQISDSEKRPIVFVDDFVGSGKQFLETWKGEIDTRNHGRTSFKKLVTSIRDLDFIYCPLMCTSYGKNNIEKECSQVTIFPAHFLPSKYSALAPDSIIWPKDLLQTAPTFLESVCLRAGIPDWKGFHDLALTIGFAHGIPDASLPIFYFSENGWNPLMERR